MAADLGLGVLGVMLYPSQIPKGTRHLDILKDDVPAARG